MNPGNPSDQPAEASTPPEDSPEQPPATAETSEPADEKQAEPGNSQPSEASVEDAPETAAPPSSGRPAASSGQPAAPSGGEAEPKPKPKPKGETAQKSAKAQPRLSKRDLKKKKAEEKKIKAFRDYFDYREELRKIPPHRVLAINRGERAKVLRVKIESDLDAMHRVLDEMLVPPEHPHADYLRGCARDSLGRLIVASLEREARRELTDRAEAHAVDVFARNLRNLLLQPPVRNRRVLAVDPGFKSGCKLAALDQFGNMLEKGVIYLVGRPERRRQAKEKVIDLIERFQLSVVVIGNGTACRECEDFFAELISGELQGRDVAYVIVNEAGASVYSTSRVGREEFPGYDASLRGAISIGRRLQDPLSELVKIDAANIGVGLYQHDVKAKHLKTSLDEVVESCVNYVGVDVNTASAALLRYVSGLNQLTARRVHDHRREHGPFRSRDQLREVPGFGEATFVQAAGFLKIDSPENPLDATWIHPESYEAANRVLDRLQCTAADLTDKQKAAGLAQRVAEVDLEAMAQQLEIGTLTLKDILAQLARPGRDPREDLPAPVFKQGVLKLEDLEAGMELTGTVLNVVDFGAFVDIGMHDSGLIHVSQLADKFIRDPHEVVAVGDIVKVWVIEVDKQRRRVSLTMVQPGTKRPPPGRRHEKREEGADGSQRGGRGEKSTAAARPRRPRPSGTPKDKGPPRGKRPPRGKGPPRGRDASTPRHRPKTPPKPVIPLTEEMKSGKEPLRTFGDLAQFFRQQGQDEQPNSKPAEEQAVRGEAEAAAAGAPASQEETTTPATAAASAAEPSQGAEHQPQTAATETPGAETAAPPSSDETPTPQPVTQTTSSEPQEAPHEVPAVDDQVQQPKDEAVSTPSQGEGTSAQEEGTPGQDDQNV